MNLQGALWMENPKEVSRERHTEFFKYLTNSYDAPMHHLHFEKDFPISLHALIYIPKHHAEKFGNARMKPGVDLYSRKVLIQKHSTELLPDWLRFLKGVVDSQDLVLNISRESTQNSLTLKAMRKILVKGLLSQLRSLSKAKPDVYRQFYAEYNTFLKEGVCTDREFKDLLAPLLRFESSLVQDGSNSGAGSGLEPPKEGSRSLDDYLDAMKEGQRAIYYIVTSDRTSALRSPYFESLKRSGREVLFLYSPIDEFVMQGIRTFKERPLVSIESGDVDKADLSENDIKQEQFHLTETQTEDVIEFLTSTLESKVKKVVPSSRLFKSPAIVTGHENASITAMMRLTGGGATLASHPVQLEINPGHKVLRGLFYTMSEDKELAKKVALQLFSHAMIDAGLQKDSRSFLGRMNDLMAAAMDVDGIEMELREKLKKGIDGKV